MEKVEILNQFLLENKIQANCINSFKKGCVNVFELETKNSFRLKKLSALHRELMLVLKSHSMPSIKIDHNKSLVQIELMFNQIKNSSLIENLSDIKAFDNENIPMNIGTSFKGDKITIDVSKNPHLLIGGATGAGKSTLLNNIISNLLIFSNTDLYIVDTKVIEFNMYQQLSERCKIIDSYAKYIELLEYLISIMEKRYNFLKNNKNININSNKYFKPIVLIIDEFADLSMQDKGNVGYNLLCRLVQKCRASGIYCILATQRPSADILTGVIKANFPARIACRVASRTDSRIILDGGGAENLYNIGDAIIKNYKYDMEKFNISYSSSKDILEYFNEKMETNTSVPLYYSGNSWIH